MIDSPWFPLLYQYTVGGAVFVLAIVIAVKTKALKLSLKKDKGTLWVLVIGFLLFLTLHSIMILVSGA